MRSIPRCYYSVEKDSQTLAFIFWNFQKLLIHGVFWGFFELSGLPVFQANFRKYHQTSENWSIKGKMLQVNWWDLVLQLLQWGFYSNFPLEEMNWTSPSKWMLSSNMFYLLLFYIRKRVVKFFRKNFPNCIFIVSFAGKHYGALKVWESFNMQVHNHLQ